MNEAVRVADARGEPLILLEGNPRYYERFGFWAAPTRAASRLQSESTSSTSFGPAAHGRMTPRLRGRAVYL